MNNPTVGQAKTTHCAHAGAALTTSARLAEVWCIYCRITVTMPYQGCT